MVDVFELVLQSVLTGIGTGLGTWIALRYAIPRAEKTENKIKEYAILLSGKDDQDQK